MKIIGIGDNVIDRYLNLHRIYPGGNAVNVAVHMARQGAQASYLGVLADDPGGMLIRRALREEGVDISRCVLQEGGTTKQCDQNVVEGERAFDLLCTSCNAKLDHQISRLGELPGVLAFDYSTKEKYRTEEFLSRTCPWLDLALFSWEGTEQEFREFAKKIHGQGACHVLGTMGMKGSLCYNGEEFIKGPVYPVKCVDTMGAGDSYLAAFMYALLEKGWKKGSCLGGTVIAEAMERAARYSAENCKKDGGFGHGADLQ